MNKVIIRHVQVVYLLEQFGIAIEEDISTPLDKVILVDASELRDLDKFIRPESVVEIIDRRKFNDAPTFKHAKIQKVQYQEKVQLLA